MKMNKFSVLRYFDEQNVHLTSRFPKIVYRHFATFAIYSIGELKTIYTVQEIAH